MNCISTYKDVCWHIITYLRSGGHSQKGKVMLKTESIHLPLSSWSFRPASTLWGSMAPFARWVGWVNTPIPTVSEESGPTLINWTINPSLYKFYGIHWRIQMGAEGTFAPLKNQKNQINTKERKQREREKRGISVSSPQIIIINCKSILIFLHHTFHKHLRQ